MTTEWGIFLQSTAPHPAYKEGKPPLVIIPTSAFLQKQKVGVNGMANELLKQTKHVLKTCLTTKDEVARGLFHKAATEKHLKEMQESDHRKKYLQSITTSDLLTLTCKLRRLWLRDYTRIPAVMIVRTHLHLLLYALTRSVDKRGSNACTTTCNTMCDGVILLQTEVDEYQENRHCLVGTIQNLAHI